MRKNGFTLLEMMVAVFIITIGLIAVMSLIQQAVASVQLASSRLTAAYLTQEGLEIVRNLRDANWLLQRTDPGLSWDAGLAVGDWEADFNDFVLTSWGGRNLKINGGFYNYDAGEDAKFKRKITIQKPQADILQVSVQISWQERGLPQSLSVQENLYNWR